METNRDAMHAAGGSFMACQLQREQGASAAAPTTEKPKREPRAVLNLREDYDLTAWMHGREPKWGETPADIFEQARAALPQITKMNVDHVKTRLDALSETLPKATPPVRELSDKERIERLEKIICCSSVRTSAQASILSRSSLSLTAWLIRFNPPSV